MIIFKSNDSYKKLKENVKKIGMLAPIIVNKRTGNVVSGHQRLKIMDELNKHCKDYELTIAEVDLDEKTEKEQNIFLNNPLAQGEFDFDKIEVLIKEDDLKMIDIGFNETEAFQIFGTDFIKETDDVELYEGLSHAYKQAEESFAKKMKQDKEKGRFDDFYFVVVFKNKKERDDYLQKIGFDTKEFNPKFIAAPQFIENINPQK